MTTNNMTYSTQEIRAFITLYQELGLDITSLPTDLEHDYLTVNDGKDGNTYYQICVRCPGITLVNGTKAYGTTLSAGANRYTDCFMPAGSGYVAINGVYDFVDACQYK